MRKLTLADIDVVMDIYLNKPVLSTAEIKRLFNCKDGAALKKKKQAQELMTRRGIDNYSRDTVDMNTAFEAWHIDIADIEKRFIKRQKLKERGMIQ